MAAEADKKTMLLDAMGQHVLRYGLNTASLRPLAQAAGTSDRMLVYHFGSKAALVDALLSHLAGGLAAKLSAAVPPHHFTDAGSCLRSVVELMRARDLEGYVRVWLDVVSAAAQGSESHRASGHAVLDGFLHWIASRLPADHADPLGTAAAILPLVEGVLVMDAVGQHAAADRAVEAMTSGGI